MRRRLTAALAGLVLVFAAAVPTGSAAATVSALPPLRIMTMGDSITCGDMTGCGQSASYRGELGRLLTEAGVAYEWQIHAAPGQPCDYWVPRATALVQQHQPDLVLLSCGTNNFPSNGTQSMAFQAVYQQLLINLLAGSSTVRVLNSLIQYSAIGGGYHPAKGWSGLAVTEPIVNDAIWRAVQGYFSYRVWGYANFSQIPEGYLSSDGVHPTRSGDALMGRIWYNVIRANGLVSLPADVPLPCGLSGRRATETSPQYTPITPGCPVV